MQVKRLVLFSETLVITDTVLWVLTAPSHRHCCPQFTDEETEVQRDYVTIVMHVTGGEAMT